MWLIPLDPDLVLHLPLLQTGKPRDHVSDDETSEDSPVPLRVRDVVRRSGPVSRLRSIGAFESDEHKFADG